ncbi:MerR family transcriptional regulator [Actinomadura madurae]|uniref:helix-turn-helix domain-containing protein n=1 Tax=Actinomadura madurae TaxID=1993 RepID=UPI000D989B06|nr:MerR family transcriptional regulator [Actinomadura madurae]SPT60058.1 Beta antigen [Actinomadura madurae]
MERTWTIGELAEDAAAALAADGSAQVSGRVRDLPNERLIRWYTTIGLVDPPLGRRGRTSLYGPRHLLQLVAVKRRQAAGRSIAEIQLELAGAPNATLAQIAALPTPSRPHPPCTPRAPHLLPPPRAPHLAQTRNLPRAPHPPRTWHPPRNQNLTHSPRARHLPQAPRTRNPIHPPRARSPLRAPRPPRAPYALRDPRDSRDPRVPPAAGLNRPGSPVRTMRRPRTPKLLPRPLAGLRAPSPRPLTPWAAKRGSPAPLVKGRVSGRASGGHVQTCLTEKPLSLATTALPITPWSRGSGSCPVSPCSWTFRP